MKIDSTGRTTGGAVTSARQKPAVATPKSTTPPAEVQVTASAGLQGVEAALANAPVVNADRVAEIKQAIIDGRFQVNADRIAGGLIESVRQLLASRK